MRDSDDLNESLIFCAFLAIMTILVVIVAYFATGGFLID